MFSWCIVYEPITEWAIAKCLYELHDNFLYITLIVIIIVRKAPITTAADDVKKNRLLQICLVLRAKTGFKNKVTLKNNLSWLANFE